MSAFVQNLIIVGGILVLLGLGYFLYTQDSGGETKSEASARVAAESAEFLRRLEELKKVELNGEIFSDARFNSLVNYSAPVLSEPVGNPSPFEISN